MRGVAPRLAAPAPLALGAAWGWSRRGRPRAREAAGDSWPTLLPGFLDICFGMVLKQRTVRGADVNQEYLLNMTLGSAVAS